MKRLVRSLVSLGTIVCVCGLVLSAAENRSQGPTPPPLVIEEDAPLLMEDARQDASPGKPKQQADNSACYVCHANYQQESLVMAHATEELGCVNCHGDSFEHRNDENNTTPPQTMFPRGKIDAACRECHADHDVSPIKVIEVFLQKCPRDADPQSLVCTDCHGEHRLKVRTVRWDKVTGKLISVLEKKTP